MPARIEPSHPRTGSWHADVIIMKLLVRKIHDHDDVVTRVIGSAKRHDAVGVVAMKYIGVATE